MSHTGEPGAVGEPGLTFQRFLELMNSDLQNEWTHLQFYLYHASSISGLHAAEYKEFFTEAAKGEMEHVQQFLDRLYGFNYTQPHQSGSFFPYYTKVADAVAAAINMENDVVKNYTKRLQQLEQLSSVHPERAAYLTIFYEDQIKDSYEDCEKMRRLAGDEVRWASVQIGPGSREPC